MNKKWEWKFRLSNLECPCKGCAKRGPECHGVCPEYKEYQKKATRENNRIKKRIYLQGLTRRIDGR